MTKNQQDEHFRRVNL